MVLKSEQAVIYQNSLRSNGLFYSPRNVFEAVETVAIAGVTAAFATAAVPVDAVIAPVINAKLAGEMLRSAGFGFDGSTVSGLGTSQIAEEGEGADDVPIFFCGIARRGRVLPNDVTKRTFATVNIRYKNIDAMGLTVCLLRVLLIDIIFYLLNAFQLPQFMRQFVQCFSISVRWHR